MTVIRVKGFKIFRDRHGRERCYHRKTGLPIDLRKYPKGSAEFLSECARIGALISRTAPKPGTLGLLIEAYRRHESFTDLAQATKITYQGGFDYLKPICDTPLVRFDRPLVVQIRDKARVKGRVFANHLKALLSVLFSWGSERGYIKDNPASGIKSIKRSKNLPDPNRPWTDQEREAVLAVAPPHMVPAIGLMMYTAIGPTDALTLPKTAYKDGTISTRRSKTGEYVFWPCPAPLATVLEAAPKHDALTLCANSKGRPWTKSGFAASWRPLKLKLEQEGKIGPRLTLYGLRHTVAVILREIGFDERSIADALGQATIEMARKYSKGADLRSKMQGVAQSFEAELNKRTTKTVKPG
jgi:integrase